jgi:outer membrane protein assembly factor BamB
MLVCAWPVVANAQNWTGLGGGAGRICIAVDGPNTIDQSTLAWKTPIDEQDYDLAQLQSISGPVIYSDKVFIYAKCHDVAGAETNARLMAFNAQSGQFIWQAIIDKAFNNSWSSPAVDSKHNTVLISSSNKVYAVDANSGAIRWTTTLDTYVVNASVCVANDILHARAFITDFKPTASGGKLYCINLDANDTANPHNPGKILWSDVLGMTSGNTPAYKNGVVYVASIRGTTASTGTIYAYDATATVATRKWAVTDSALAFFYGGVTVTKAGFLYAATFNFSSGENNSHLVKVDVSNGTLVWKIATERTDSIPIVVGENIYISGGVVGYGSRPKLSAYHDNGDSATSLWETPQSMPFGGWTYQPVYANGKLHIGKISNNLTNAVTDLYILDVSRTPADADFITGNFHGGGNNPAVMHDSIYTAGYDIDGTPSQDVLLKFHQPALFADINKDGVVDEQDLASLMGSWLFTGAIGVNRADFDLDGDIDNCDYATLVQQWHMQAD